MITFTSSCKKQCKHKVDTSDVLSDASKEWINYGLGESKYYKCTSEGDFKDSIIQFTITRSEQSIREQEFDFDRELHNPCDGEVASLHKEYGAFYKSEEPYSLYLPIHFFNGNVVQYGHAYEEVENMNISDTIIQDIYYDDIYAFDAKNAISKKYGAIVFNYQDKTFVRLEK